MLFCFLYLYIGFSMKRLTIALFTLFILAACGGGGSNSPPNVAGTYSCTNGCNGICTFASTLTATQSGSQVTSTSATATCTGSIQNDGSFSGTCTGNAQTCS